jgi:HEAT repeat protein
MALGSMQPDAVAALIALASTQETDPVTRAEAAHSLGLIGDKAAVAALVAAQSDLDMRVRDAATIALRTLG